MNLLILNDSKCPEATVLISAAAAVMVPILMENYFNKPRTRPPTKCVLLAQY
jgi:hypothetical protein